MVNIINRPADSFAQIPNALFRNPNLKSRAVHVMGNLLTHSSGQDVSIAFIAKQTGLSKNTVCAALDDLVKAGYAVRVPVPGEHGQFDRNDYQIDCDKIVADGKEAEKARNQNRRSTPSQNLRHGGSPSQNLGQATVAKFGIGPSQNLGRIEDQLENKGGEDARAHASAGDDKPETTTAGTTPPKNQDVITAMEVAPPTAGDDKPVPYPWHCDEHAHVRDVPGACRACAEARRAYDHAAVQATHAREQQRRAENAAARTCPTCKGTNQRVGINPNTGMEYPAVCHHTAADHAAHTEALNARTPRKPAALPDADTLEGAAAAAAAHLASRRARRRAAA